MSSPEAPTTSIESDDDALAEPFAPPGGWVPALAALLCVVAGAALLLTGALPAVHHRAWLPGLELSHFAGSVAGLMLLIVARGLARRLDSARRVAVWLLLIGAVSLAARHLAGEALVLGVLALALLPCGPAFYRYGALLAEPFSPALWGGIALVLGASLGLGFFALHHVELRSELFWRFALDQDVPRFLRASVAALTLTLAVGVYQLLRPATGATAPAQRSELDRAVPLIDASPRARAHLALVGDKALLFHEGGRAMLAYGVAARVFIAAGDPLGPDAEATELCWAFKSLADRHRAHACFYEVGPEHLPRYLDLGLTLRKVGEEAVVPLADFSLDGPERAVLRQNLRKAERETLTFEVAAKEQVPALLDTLERISDDWLARKGRGEKRFSIGYFDRDYLLRTPVALVRRGGEVVAFANLWAPASRGELSIDLMRQTASAPKAVMDYLFIQLMLWGKREGFAQFSLGGAPFSGLDGRSLAPAWNRLGDLLFRHGEGLYHFRGVRQFKDKFRPRWEPRYLAAPGGLALPRVLAALAALGSGPR